MSTDEIDIIGKRISHYLIMGRLGAGGTGVVYLARDQALGRLAALKLVPEGWEDKYKKRLVYEGRESAKLQHPAIATFYEAGEDEGQIFLAMEYVRGKTLRQRLYDGPLEPRDAVSATADLLAAVSHAHFAGILHRDIKPENIMLRAVGGLKLLDFGLALPIRPEVVKEGDGGEDKEVRTLIETLTRRSELGAIVGTPGYMSPEQLLGQELDARSDIFAIGAVLYEMLTGAPAFPGRTSKERMLAVLKGRVRPIQGIGLLAKLGSIVSKALQMEPGDRQASSARLLLDLQEACQRHLPGRGSPQIAVLDLRSRSAESGDTWLDQGLAESVTEGLGRIEGVEIVPRAKTRLVSPLTAGGDVERGAIEAGHRLACRYVVFGEFQRRGEAVTVAMQLLDVVTEQRVCEVTAEANTSEFFKLRDQICTELTHGIAGGPAPASGAPDPIAVTGSRVEAFKCYARAHKLHYSLQRGTFDEAVELYSRALDLDPTYGAPLAGLAHMTALRYTHTGSHGDLALGARYAREAIQLDPKSAQAYTALAYAMWRLGSLEDAHRAAARAMDLAPEDPWPCYFGGWILYELGRTGEAIRAEQRALEIEQTHAYSWLALGSMHLDLGHLSEAAWCLRHCVEAERAGAKGKPPGSAHILGECFRRQGHLDEARTECMASLEAIELGDHAHRDVFRVQALIILGWVALDQGDREGAKAAFAQSVAHARGRSRMGSGGYMLVQALSGLARSSFDATPLDEAIALFQRREGYDFGFAAVFGHETFVLDALAAAARAVGRREQAETFERRAREARNRWLGPRA